MSAQPTISCSCGRRIEGREVLQQGYFMSQWKPVWVYVKYRCSRCRMLGEELVDYAQWDDGILGFDTSEPSPAEGAGFVSMGEIDDAEVESFARRVGALRRSDLDKLAGSLP